jgi:S-adenosylmethionine hydrolase
VVVLEMPKPVVKDGVATGMIDSSRGHLGNTTCLIDRHTFEQLGVKEGERVVVKIRKGDKVVWEEAVLYARTFGDVPVGKNLLFINSSGFVAMAVNQGNFANAYNIDSGREWTLAVRKK